MQLYDTMSRTLVTVPKEQTVSFYSCGPTVYDFPHIGNWYAFIRWDLLNRALLQLGYKTQWVMNITDVGHLVSDGDEGEDKLEKGAKREGKTAWNVAAFYTDYFIKTMQTLGFSDLYKLPKATDHIQEQIELVVRLEKKGHTYTISDGVYFDTSTLRDYGKLARLDIENLKAGARVELNSEKRNVTDFALWKFSPKNEKRDMEWDSPWGRGFPGWHIECSAMSMKYLGETLTIHAGGIDHIPVHHTNEIAQSESATGKPFASIWVHSNFILVDGKKMSKSLGNFYTLEDLKDTNGKAYAPEVFRLAVMESHYQTEANFSLEQLAAAKNRWQGLQVLNTTALQPKNEMPENVTIQMQELETLLQQAKDAAADNLNTPLVLKAINEAATYVSNKVLHTKDLQAYLSFLEALSSLTGLPFLPVDPLPEAAQQLLNKYVQSKLAKDYSTSDKLRSELAQQSIVVSDLGNGLVKWHKLIA